MAGTPGYGPWPPYNASATPEGQRAQLEATVRALREQRPGIAAEIAEFLYGLVMQQQMRDPLVISAFRRLYDHDQQIQQAEAGLRALSTSYPPAVPSQSYAPQQYNQQAYNAPPSVSPPLSQQQAWTPPVPPQSVPGGMTPSVVPGNEEMLDTRPAAQPTPIAPPPSIQPQPSNYTSQDATRPAKAPQPASAAPKQGTDRVCMHCKTPLRPKDTTCPVCGLPAEEMPAAATCVRCGNILKPTDTACPVCGTPR
jgi:RNA polymerase subunit RPABC4/transcription elongation factor Spt4